MLRVLRLKKNQARLLRIIAYPLFAIAVFVVSFYVSLPLDRIKDRRSASCRGTADRLRRAQERGASAWAWTSRLATSTASLPVGAGPAMSRCVPEGASGAPSDATQRPRRCSSSSFACGRRSLPC